MCLVWKVSCDLDRAVITTFKAICTLAKKVPDLRAREMTVVDGVKGELCNWVGIVEFLVQSAVLVYIPGNFLLDIKLPSINLVGDHGAQVLQVVHPWKRIATQVHVMQLSWLGQKCHAFGLTLLGIWVRREFKIM